MRVLLKHIFPRYFGSGWDVEMGDLVIGEIFVQVEKS